MRKTAICLLLLTLTACASVTPSRSLYGDIGGQAGVETLVDSLLDNIANDDRIFDLFKDSKIDHLRQRLIEQICNLSGGPCEYSGETMEKSHAGMHINEAQFNALVEDLIQAMENNRLPVNAQNQLLALLAPMRPQIIRR